MGILARNLKMSVITIETVKHYAQTFFQIFFEWSGATKMYKKTLILAFEANRTACLNCTFLDFSAHCESIQKVCMMYMKKM